MVFNRAKISRIRLYLKGVVGETCSVNIKLRIELAQAPSPALPRKRREFRNRYFENNRFYAGQKPPHPGRFGGAISFLFSNA